MNKYSTLIITSGYPYGEKEPFFKDELDLISSESGRVIIISCDVKSKSKREVPENVKLYRYNTATTLPKFLALQWTLFRNLIFIVRLSRSEHAFRKLSGNGLGFKKKVWLFHRIIKALQLKSFVVDVLNKENITKNVILYSYWLNTGAHAICLINFENSLKIARAHGSDLYEEKSPDSFLPLTYHSATSLDAIYFISENGAKYFRTKYKYAVSRLIVSRLGVTFSPVMNPSSGLNESIVIVSCSNMIPLKRIDLIIKALSCTNSEKNIHWIHFGSGPSEKEIKQLASNLLTAKPNISYDFMGHVANEEIKKFYASEHVDLFVNTSTTEGIPVSIMEAMSFGIPALATNVGGVNELVNERTGILIEPDSEPGLIAKIIDAYLLKSSAEINDLRNNSYSHCREYFGSESNYSSFINSVNSILAQKNQPL